MGQRLAFLDNAKMIGILLMIIGHCCTIRNAQYLYNFIYLFHMPLFFVISGYLFKPREIKTAIKKYAKAYLIPYLTMAFATLVVVFLFSYYRNLDIVGETFTLLKAIVFGHGIFGKAIPAIGVGWFLCSMFQALVIYNTISFLFDEKEKAIAVIIVFVLGWTSMQFRWLPFSTQTALCSTLFLLLGELCNKYKLLDVCFKHKPIVYLGGVIIVVLAVLFSKLSLASCNFGKPILSIPACVILCYFIFQLSKKIKLKWGELTLLFMAGNQLVSYANYKYQFGELFNTISNNAVVNCVSEVVFDLLITFGLAYLFGLIPWMKKR